MSEVPVIGSDTPVSTPSIISEELTETEVQGLVEEAKTAIKEQNFDQARDIITRLSQVYHQAQASKGWLDTFRGWISGAKSHVTIGHLYYLFFELFTENDVEAKKLVPVLSKNFSIEIDEVHCKVSAGEFSRSFNLPLKTHPEAKALLDHIFKLSYSRQFEDLKRELSQLARHCDIRQVKLSDFKNMFHCLFNSNSTFALRCFSIFEGLYEIRIIDEKRLTIKDVKSKESTSFDCNTIILSDCDRQLENIAAKEKSLIRLIDYCFLARHQVERAPEIMRKAEEQLEFLQDNKDGRLTGKFVILAFYFTNNDDVNFERIAAVLERELNASDEFEKNHFLIARLNVLKAEVSLEKRDRSGYNDAIMKVVQEMEFIIETTARKLLQQDLERLKSKREETFPIDQMKLQAMKA